MSAETEPSSNGVYRPYADSNSGSVAQIDDRDQDPPNAVEESERHNAGGALSGVSLERPKLTASASSEAWFVPDPDEEPPIEGETLHVVLPVSLKASLSNATLPSSHTLGVRALPSSSSSVASATPLSVSPSSSAWGSAMADGESVGHLSTLSTSPPETNTRGAFAFNGGALSSPSSGGWASAVPHDLLSSPRGHFSSGELDPLSSPRVSAHRVSQTNSQEALFAGQAAPFGGLASSSPRALPPSFHSSPSSSYGTPSSSSSMSIPRPAPHNAAGTPGTPGTAISPNASAAALHSIQLTNRPPMARDSFETTDGSSSHISGTHSFTSRITSLTEEPDLNSDQEEDDVSESSHETPHSATHARFVAAQQTEVLIGSVPTASSMTMVSPRGAAEGNGSGSLKSSDRPSGGASSAPRHGTMRPPRTKSVALNPMLVTRNSGAIVNASASMNSSTPAAASPLAPSNTSTPAMATSHATNTILSANVNPLSPRHGPGVGADSIDSRRGSSLQSLQSIPAPIAAALNLVTEAPEMKTGGDTQILQWAWDLRKKHPFLKISTDHSSLSWSSNTNYGLTRGNTRLRHRKTFIELAKTRGVSQLLQIGLVKGSLDWNCSPEKMQFNSVKIAGEWAAVWVKSSTTGDRFGVLFDLDEHKMTVYRNGVVAYTHDLPASFNLPKEDVAEQASTSTEVEIAPAASPSSAPSSTAAPEIEAESLYPFVGVCGDQDLLITEMPEFEKYVDIAWAHERKTQLCALTESLEGIPAILEVLGLQKLRPKFEGMSLAAFQKLKDADLRKIGASTEQRRRLLSQIETMK